MNNEVFEYKIWWKDATREEISKAFDFCKGYIDFLNQCKTEREVVSYVLDLCQKEGFIDIDEAIDSNWQLQPGTKIYRNIRGKSIILGIVGREPAVKGMNIVGAHIDSPRLDFKPTPFYEDTDMVLAKTHYYGGIKKYQWVCIPLALHGVVVLKNGKTVNIQVGDKPGDPGFVITDLLPHLARLQMSKKIDEAITGEGLNVVMSSLPLEAGKSKSQDELIAETEEADPANKDKAKDPFKARLLQILWETYGITEADFVSAEIEVVPAMPAMDIGFDRSMVGGYGQDDRVCAYTALQALLDCDRLPERTVLVYLADKEEIGSMGNTGAQSDELSNFIAEFCAVTTDNYNDLITRRCIRNSALLSADVSAAVDPNYKDTHDKYNATYFGKGVVLKKYTGARGKSGASDANPEFIAAIRRILDEHNIYWQTGELGKVDLGGGGTIAQFMANLGMQVLDCGVPIMSMHSPFELASKADIYNTYLAYKVFLAEYK